MSADIGALVAAVLALIQEIGLLNGIAALTIAAEGFPYLLVLGVVVAAYYFGRSAWAASFSDSFWSEFLCILSDNVGEDGAVSDAQFQNILSGVNGIGFSAARLWLYAMVQAAGSVGLTNAARTMSTSEEICCPDCDASVWNVIHYNGFDVGIVTSRGANTIDVEGTSHPDFATPYNVMLVTDADATCCRIVAVEILTGSDVELFNVDCPNPRWPGIGTSSFIPPQTGTDTSNSLFLRGNSVPFTARITFG